MPRFEIGDTDFLLDGAPHRILAGAIHPFRVHPDLWADRIRKARLMGLNAIETYVAWNAHEPVRGQWDATGPQDLGRFLDLVAAEGMHAIVRPGPYICAEWHNGGLPVWLTSMPGVRLRSSEPQYLAAVSAYLEKVYEIVAPRQIDRGGGVILVQIENEYGAYGADKAYLRRLVDLTRACGITVPLTTVDQPQPDMLRDGSLDELHRTGSFGSRAADRLRTLRAHQPTGPLMCSEFWCGWFDWWGGPHHTTDAAASAAELDTLLSAGASVSIYMFHGGTNFGATGGANDKGRYLPIATSYDYDAPLDEAGRPTAKYEAFRAVISRYAPVPDEVPPAASPAPEITVEVRPVGAVLAPPHPAPGAGCATFDELGHLGPLLQYDAPLPHDRGGQLHVGEVRDRAYVFVDGMPCGILSRTLHERALTLPPGRALTILVEDQGRVNYDRRLGEEKGLIGPVTVDGTPLGGLAATPIDLATLVATAREAAAPTGIPLSGPTVFAGTFTRDAATDLFLDTDDLGHGFAFVNGFFAGRYWRTGPQRTMYIPAPVIRSGQNDLVLVELEQLTASQIRFIAEPRLGHREE